MVKESAKGGGSGDEDGGDVVSVDDEGDEVQVVKAVHGEDGKLSSDFRQSYPNTVWIQIVKAISNLKEKGVDLLSFCREPTNWCNIIPIKINVMARRLSLDKLPTCLNLDARGIDVPTMLCPICGEHSENISHLFFSCSFVSQVYVLIARWWDLDVPRLNSYNQCSD
ncbi:RNA-directed DNA polymerase, eukaryota [Tanacetum coccineum]